MSFIFPTITLEQARHRGETPGSLQAVAAWNERMAKGAAKKRRLRQARELREVARRLRAANDNMAHRAAA